MCVNEPVENTQPQNRLQLSEHFQLRFQATRRKQVF